MRFGTALSFCERARIKSGASDSSGIEFPLSAPEEKSLQHGHCPEVKCGADRRVTKPVLKTNGKCRTTVRIDLTARPCLFLHGVSLITVEHGLVSCDSCRDWRSAPLSRRDPPGRELTDFGRTLRASAFVRASRFAWVMSECRNCPDARPNFQRPFVRRWNINDDLTGTETPRRQHRSGTARARIAMQSRRRLVPTR